MKAVVIFSGGQDSTTCLYWAIKKFGKGNVFTITFGYGQKHSVETQQAKIICERLSIPFVLINMDFLQTVCDSALLVNGDVNALNSKGLPASFVPNRNQLFITIAHAYAQKIGALHLVTGVCETDYSGYPDCRDEFIRLITEASNNGSKSNILVHTPLMYLDKASTFLLAKELGCLQEVIEFSHTCYNGDRSKLNVWGYGCGECPACILRAKGWNKFNELSNLKHMTFKP